MSTPHHRPITCNLLYLSLSTILLPVLLHLPTITRAHSQLSQPQSTAPMTCRLGGEPRFGVQHCHGPCDLRAIKGHFANHASPTSPAATFRRGQRASFKYQRNNHAPGGFVRLTLVPVADMMRKHIHARNAFHYSCWGARAVVARREEKQKDRFGFSVAGNDGQQHDLPVAYYVTRAKIPECVPDGDYVLGWVWYGGVGGGVKSNKVQEPLPYGYFGDYWSCSFVRVKGGAALREECEAVFDNDMKRFSPEGCMSANDRPGVCSWEPCRVVAKYQKPGPFKGKRKVRKLSRWMYGGKKNGGEGGKVQQKDSNATTVSKVGAKRNERRKNDGRSPVQARRACRCLIVGRECGSRLARVTKSVCAAGRRRKEQGRACKETCCRLCREEKAK